MPVASVPALTLSAYQVDRGCQGAHLDADPALLDFARETLDKELGDRLDQEGLIDPYAPLRAEICFEQMHLRTTLVTFLLYPVVRPDQLKVQIMLLKGNQLLHTWHLNAENNAGGYMASPGRERRYRMLVSLINRKFVRLLKTSDSKPS
ncbi:hypothetical protein FEF65_05350 [Mariprofundus erugo]|uniref:Uncharacterized protein n=1 Tax=Mariprofundus erugo TaxID=2528639 RepID=A0A5R9GNC5_9PROT|nr:hypothetical protein [Mariprofundus erugo]TLS67876.1 hypothetical protein FEF65_05350 [Mariprofundus erugo]